MALIDLHINGKTSSIDVDPQMPLLWAIRDFVGLTGTKFSCGIAQCGACNVLLDDQAIRSCITPVSAVQGKSITTIEGLSENNDHPVQKAWIKHQVPQCGYCQSGQIIAAAALLNHKPNPAEEDISRAMSTVYCRCGTYPRIKKALVELSKS